MLAGASPDRFALVVASGPARASTREREGMIRHPNADRGAVAAEIPRRSLARLSRQHERERARPERAARVARLDRRTVRRPAPCPALLTSTGSVEVARPPLRLEQPIGRPLVVGRAPMPYTVSVGNTIRSPRRAAATASAIGSAHGRRPDHDAVAAGEIARPAHPASPASLERPVITDRPRRASISTTTAPPVANQRSPRAKRRSYSSTSTEQRGRRVGAHLGRQASRPRPGQVRRIRSRPDRPHPRSSAGNGSNRSPCSAPSPRARAPRRSRARGPPPRRRRRWRTRLRPVARRAIARAIAPDPVQRSATTGASPLDLSARPRRGSRSPGAGRRRRDAPRASRRRNACSPVRCCRGHARASPAQRASERLGLRRAQALAPA